MTSQVLSEDRIVEPPIGFAQPATQPTADPPDPSATTTERPPPGPGPDGPGGPGFDAAGSSPSSARAKTSSSPASSEDAAPEPYTTLIAALAGLGTLGVDVAMGGDQRWVAREEELKAFSAPLARIAARHSPVVIGQATDVADILEAGVVVTAYGVERVLMPKLAAAAQPAAEDAVADAGEG